MRAATRPARPGWCGRGRRRARRPAGAARQRGSAPRCSPRSAGGLRRPAGSARRSGPRITAFATNTTRGQLPDLELRHRRRARCEDRIRTAKDTGLTNLPLHDFAQNQIWCAIVALACELTAWMQMLAPTGHQARRWEPKRLRLRLFSIPPASPPTADSSDCTYPRTPPGPICSPK
jgi:Transposase DDE domain group 1